MKKILLFSIPIGLVAILLGAHAGQSFGFGRQHGMFTDFLLYRLDRLSQELKLDPSQQNKMDGFKRDLEALIDQRMEKRREVRKALQTELAKENSDVRQITSLIHQQIDDTARLAHDLTDRVGELYQDLTPEQRKTLSNIIEERMRERELE